MVLLLFGLSLCLLLCHDPFLRIFGSLPPDHMFPFLFDLADVETADDWFELHAEAQVNKVNFN